MDHKPEAITVPIDPWSDRVVIAAIVKREEDFIEEWIAYHRILGIDHFLLYDNDPRRPLHSLLARYKQFVTVIDWVDGGEALTGINPQTKAYEHALTQTDSEWMAFIDIDEFIVLRRHVSIHEFLAEFVDAEAVVLTWHVFGHNGYYDNPAGLITEALTRRRSESGRQVKSIVRRKAVINVRNAHRCTVHNPMAVFDANHRYYTRAAYDGKTEVANINHYYCRSFVNWMGRIERGRVTYSGSTYRPGDRWKHEEQACLRQFVLITKDFNELVDEYLTKYSKDIITWLDNNRRDPVR